MDIEWAHVRRELEQAIEIIQYEVEGEHQGRQVLTEAIDHVQTALLLMTGSTTDSIKGHPKGSRHVN